MEEYVNPYTDFGFKKLFGEEGNKDLLRDFLNTLLPEKHQIDTLTFHNPERLGDVRTDAALYYDIHCKNSNGEFFIVEMQRTSQNFFINRALYYISDCIRSQDPRPEDAADAEVYKLAPVYFFGVLNYTYDGPGTLFKNSLFIRNVDFRDDNHELATDLIRITLVQMRMFTKQAHELKTHQDKWFYFLKNLPTFHSIPAILNEPIFLKAFKTTQLAGMTEEQRTGYRASRKIQLDRDATIFKQVEDGIAKGIAEGIAKGVAKGAQEKALEIARKAKAMGVPLADIAALTSLDVSEIEKLP
jgi:predicted transposase/invertase (TIGR01784 family)